MRRAGPALKQPCSDCGWREATVSCCKKAYCLLHAHCTKHAQHPGRWTVINAAAHGSEADFVRKLLSQETAKLEAELDAKVAALTAKPVTMLSKKVLRRQKAAPTPAKKRASLADIRRAQAERAAKLVTETKTALAKDRKLAATKRMLPVESIPLSSASAEKAGVTLDNIAARLDDESLTNEEAAALALVHHQTRLIVPVDNETKSEPPPEKRLRVDVDLSVEDGVGVETLPAAANANGGVGAGVGAAALPRTRSAVVHATDGENVEESVLTGPFASAIARISKQRSPQVPKLDLRNTVSQQLARALGSGTEHLWQGSGRAASQKAMLVIGEQIEQALFGLNGEDTEMYRTAAQRMVHALKDKGNGSLRTKVLAGNVSTAVLVRLSAAELANDDAKARIAEHRKRIMDRFANRPDSMIEAKFRCPVCHAEDSKYAMLRGARDNIKAEVWGSRLGTSELLIHVMCNKCGNTWERDSL